MRIFRAAAPGTLALALTLAVGPGRAGQALPSATELLAAARSGVPIELDLGPLGVRRIELEERPVLFEHTRFTVRDAGGIRPVAMPSITTLAGAVVGEPDSVVRLTVSGNGFRAGVIRTRAGSVSIESDRDVVVEPQVSGSAPTDTPVEIPKDHLALPVSAWGYGNCSVIECGTLTAHVVLDADATFTAIESWSCFERQVATLFSIDAVYASHATDFHLEITQVNCWLDSASLGGPTTDPVDYLTNVRLAWTDVGADRSTVLHATGFDFVSSTIGVAYVGGVCTRLEPATLALPGRCPYGYAVYQSVPAPGYDASYLAKAWVAAHEVGHNFNAEHGTGTGCDTGAGTIMCAHYQPWAGLAFSDASAAVIREHAEETIGFLVCPVGRYGAIGGNDC